MFTTQVHAINILKALYQDTSLGCGVLQYASQGTVMAVTGFASSSWAVRNACMQLFGKLTNNIIAGLPQVMKLAGKKYFKVRENAGNSILSHGKLTF